MGSLFVCDYGKGITMGNLCVNQIVRNIRRSIAKRSPEIWTGFGIVGMCATVVFAVKATPKALALIEEETASKNARLVKAAAEEADDEVKPAVKLTVMETVKVAWRPYVPTVVTGVFSISCLIGASSKYARRNAALAMACSVSETALSEFKEKAIETVGEKNVAEIQDRIMKNKVDADPVSKKEVVILGKESTLCYDVFSGRYFKSDIETIRKVENRLNAKMVNGENYVSLNDFYNELGLSNTVIGDTIGWRVDKGLIDVSPSYQAADNGDPCLAIGFITPPTHDYNRYY